MTTNTNDFSTLFRSLIAQWCAVPMPRSIAAAEQVLRTQVHPSLFSALQSMNRALRSLPVDALSQIIDRVGLHTLAVFYRRWYPDALPTLQSYESFDGDSAGDAVGLTRAVCDLGVLAAAFDETILHALYAAVISVQTELHLSSQFRSTEPLCEDVMLRQWTEHDIHARAEHYASTPTIVTWVNPVHVPVATSSGTQWMRIPVQVRVHDPIAQRHDVVMHPPMLVTHANVDRTVTVPYPPSVQGVSLLFRLRDQHGFWSTTHQHHLFPDLLYRFFERSGGLPVTVGPHGDIPLHAIHFHATAGEAQLPNEPVAALRHRSSHLDIQRLHPDVQLTVFS